MHTCGCSCGVCWVRGAAFASPCDGMFEFAHACVLVHAFLHMTCVCMHACVRARVRARVCAGVHALSSRERPCVRSAKPYRTNLSQDIISRLRWTISNGVLGQQPIDHFWSFGPFLCLAGMHQLIGLCTQSRSTLHRWKKPAFVYMFYQALEPPKV